MLTMTCEQVSQGVAWTEAFSKHGDIFVRMSRSDWKQRKKHIVTA